jgi:MYXO-CTERM domain-containing protein
MRSTRTLSVAFASAIVLWAASAAADTAAQPGTPQFLQTSAAQVILIGNGNRGRMDGDMRARYPGFEQTTIVQSRNHIVAITMEAVQEPNQGPVQCSCTSYQLQPNGAPTVVAPLTRLTAYQGERACNHPMAAADGNGNIVWAFGSDSQTLAPNNNNRPNMYAGIISEKCEQLAAPTMLSTPRNANDGAPDVVYMGGNHFVLGYYSDGGDNGGQNTFPGPTGRYSIALGVDVVPGGVLPTLNRTWIMPVVTMTDIGRPTIAKAGDDNRAIFCAPYGPNRPSMHIQCALLDTTTGNAVWKDFAAKGDPQNYSFFNQPTVRQLDATHFALMAIESSGQGKNGRDVKGSNLSHIFMLERQGDSMSVVSNITGATAHQTHSSLCTGAYGEQGTPSIAAFSAAPTGIGRAAMQMVSFDANAKTFASDPQADLWPAAWYGDSGHLSNWYGRNPMKQGRDFMRCIGDVQNPGYHVQGGFMPDVKAFFVGAVHGRVPGEAKNSLFISFVPGQMDKKPVPQNPVPAGETPNLGDNTPPPSSDSGGSGGCGCSTPGTTHGGALAALAGLGALGLVVARRRKR